MPADLFSDRTWFAVVSKPTREAFAAGKLEEQGYGVWLPLCRTLGRRSGKVKVVEGALFPRYLFAGLTTEQPFRPILNTPGVAFVMRDAGGIAVEVRASVLRAIKARVDADGGSLDLIPKPVAEKFVKGQRVRVKEGPFEGLEGLYVASSRGRVTLLLDILGGREVSGIPSGWVSNAERVPCPAVAVSTAKTVA